MVVVGLNGSKMTDYDNNETGNRNYKAGNR